jgi:hypothetical protein
MQYFSWDFPIYFFVLFHWLECNVLALGRAIQPTIHHDHDGRLGRFATFGSAIDIENIFHLSSVILFRVIVVLLAHVDAIKVAQPFQGPDHFSRDIFDTFFWR